MKDQRNQYLRTGASIIVLSFLGTVAISLLAPQVTHTGEGQDLQAYRKARDLGRSIATRFESRMAPLGSRNPASAETPQTQGYMGTNEQGQPYHYSVLQTDAGVARVVIRSGGPKGQIEYVEEGGQEMPLPESPSSNSH
ncbi:MAG: hypothetical protein ACK5Y2_07145 [Bdellovibrionales bacterium]|jgi:hypothetical protein